MKTILYIHGAFATPGSFTRIKENLPNHEAILLQYNVGDDIEKVITDCVKLLKENGELRRGTCCPNCSKIHTCGQNNNDEHTLRWQQNSRYDEVVQSTSNVRDD
jgi:hypothetical protein